MNRRRFIQLGSTALAFSLHPRQVSANSGLVKPRTRLKDLRLRTAISIEEMADFYAGTLGMKILERDREQLTIAAGETRLSYVKQSPEEGSPFYHVAFNIPENKVFSAREWQLERTPLDPNPNAERHPEYSDLVYFSRWDAHAIFFRDPAGNILEHIARHTLDNAAPGPFSSRDILCCSEIALVLDADDLRPHADRLGKEIGVERYRNSTSSFVALGDENGLVLIMRKGFSLRGDADIYPTQIEIDAPETFDHSVPGLPYDLRSG